MSKFKIIILFHLRSFWLSQTCCSIRGFSVQLGDGPNIDHNMTKWVQVLECYSIVNNTQGKPPN